jgi:hypothetical protein
MTEARNMYALVISQCLQTLSNAERWLAAQS